MVIKLLPRGIKTLMLKRIVGEDIEEGQNLFPPNLTYLDLTRLPEARKTCDILMKCLPQTLKSFTTSFAGENVEIIELLPPSVTYCYICSSEGVSHAPIVTVPQGIRDFNAFVGWEIEDMPIFVLPRCLTRLSMHGLPSLELVKSLPQTFTQLSLWQPVEAEILDLLPSGLHILSLCINGEVNATESFERFTVLESLTIHSDDEKYESYFRGTFPASLRTISLAKVLDNSKIVELPGSLQELTIAIDAELTNEIIQQLPRSLRSLRLQVSGWSHVTDDARQRFPPHIAPGSTSIKNILNPSQDFPFLPLLHSCTTANK